MTPLPPDLPDEFGPDDDPWHDTQDGTWLGILFIATMIGFVLLVVALYQWRW